MAGRRLRLRVLAGGVGDRSEPAQDGNGKPDHALRLRRRRQADEGHRWQHDCVLPNGSAVSIRARTRAIAPSAPGHTRNRTGDGRRPQWPATGWGWGRGLRWGQGR